jgi:hypothetical protein
MLLVHSTTIDKNTMTIVVDYNGYQIEAIESIQINQIEILPFIVDHCDALVESIDWDTLFHELLYEQKHGE